MKGTLADIGYDANKHDALIEKVKGRNLTDIAEVIRAVAGVYQTLYDQDAYEINCGCCEDFAADVIAVLTGDGRETDELFAAWHDNMLDCTEGEADWWSHKFVVYKGRYYDSQAPEGVDEWRQLPAFQNNPFLD